jgi:hypothetical protein
MSNYTWLYHTVPTGAQRLPSCCICNDPVLLETSNTDEYGQAVHEECYVLKVCLKAEFLNDARSVPIPANRHAIHQPGETTMAAHWEPPMPRPPAVLATVRMQRAERIPCFNRPWKVDMALVVTVLVIACWVAYSDRDAASFLRSSGLQRSIAIEEQAPLQPQKAMPAKHRFMFQAVSGSVEQARTTTRLQRVGFAENEVVHIGDDVTVRYFNPKPTAHRLPVGQYQVVHIGEDVTVRYFTPISRQATN